jgi:hypothetical protein
MSISEYISLELKVSRKRFKLKLGDLVVAVEDERKKKMVVSALLSIGSNEDHSDDYVCLALNSRGRILNKTFQEKELKKIEK